MPFQFLACQLTCVLLLHKSHYVSTFKLCVSIDMHFFGCKFLRVKNEILSNIHIAGNLIFNHDFENTFFLNELVISFDLLVVM